MKKTYDCRREREQGSITFPCSVDIMDPLTGKIIPNVFYATTSPPRIGRFVTDALGQPMVNSATRRKVVHVDDNGKRTVEIVHDRLEYWENRPWVAVSVKTRETIEKSEGVS